MAAMNEPLSRTIPGSEGRVIVFRSRAQRLLRVDDIPAATIHWLSQSLPIQLGAKAARLD